MHRCTKRCYVIASRGHSPWDLPGTRATDIGSKHVFPKLHRLMKCWNRLLLNSVLHVLASGGAADVNTIAHLNAMWTQIATDSKFKCACKEDARHIQCGSTGNALYIQCESNRRRFKILCESNGNGVKRKLNAEAKRWTQKSMHWRPECEFNRNAFDVQWEF